MRPSTAMETLGPTHQNLEKTPLKDKFGIKRCLTLKNQSFNKKSILVQIIVSNTFELVFEGWIIQWVIPLVSKG